MHYQWTILRTKLFPFVFLSMGFSLSCYCSWKRVNQIAQTIHSREKSLGETAPRHSLSGLPRYHFAHVLQNVSPATKLIYALAWYHINGQSPIFLKESVMNRCVEDFGLILQVHLYRIWFESTTCSDHFWKFRCREDEPDCGAKHISKSSTIRSQHVKKTPHVRNTFGRSNVALRSTRKGLCTF